MPAEPSPLTQRLASMFYGLAEPVGEFGLTAGDLIRYGTTPTEKYKAEVGLLPSTAAAYVPPTPGLPPEQRERYTSGYLATKQHGAPGALLSALFSGGREAIQGAYSKASGGPFLRPAGADEEVGFDPEALRTTFEAIMAGARQRQDLQAPLAGLEGMFERARVPVRY